MKYSIRSATIILLSLYISVASLAKEKGIGAWLSDADAYLTELSDEDNFSGSVLIAVDGESLLAQGYGLANREHGIPNEADTKFRLGSLTKQFTAMVVLILEEQGRLGIDHLVAAHMSNAPEHWSEITLLNLLNHTSGIPSFTSFPDNLRHERLPTTVEATVNRFIDKPLDFEPGSEYRYSNSGYALLGHLIELVTGKSYEDAVGELIFAPLGMNDSGYDRPRTVLEKRASGYSKVDDGFLNAVHFEMDTPHAAGALYSTVNDLLIWDQALYSEDLVSAATIRKMETAHLKDYGLGVGVRDGHVFHGGGISGFRTFLIRVPEQRVCMAVLSNLESARPDQIARRLIEISLAGIAE